MATKPPETGQSNDALHRYRCRAIYTIMLFLTVDVRGSVELTTFDRAKVEVGVQIAERWILAALRHRKFFSLAELNPAIRELLEKLNHHPFKKREGSRHCLFQEVDRPAMRPLPQQRFDLSVWTHATVNIDYHVEVDRSFYSVPYQLAGQKVDVRATPTTVEIFHRGVRVASHIPRWDIRDGISIVLGHYPPGTRLSRHPYGSGGTTSAARQRRQLQEYRLHTYAAV